jgi:predicted esterase
VVLALLLACREGRRATLEEANVDVESRYRAGTLRARPDRATRGTLAPGRYVIDLGDGRPAVLFAGDGYDPARAAPLVVTLHGAGGTAEGALRLLDDAVASGSLVLAVPSLEATWDVIARGLGPDVARIDAALAAVFARAAVDPSRVAISGFSDGASYALTLGLVNGDLFTHLVAFSPGFAAPPAVHGRPKIFVSHGEHDRVLPIDRCSREIVRRLEALGLDVTYEEFDGPHEVPRRIARAGMQFVGA